MGRLVSGLLLLFLLLPSLQLAAQSPAETYSRKNSFGFFGEYSNDSSHILSGQSANRKLLNFGATYSRLLLRRPVDVQYLIELRPVLLESDPVSHAVETYTGSPTSTTFTSAFRTFNPCRAGTFTSSGTFPPGDPNAGAPYTFTSVNSCGRQWTFGQGLSPFGFKFNLLPRHRIQPVFTLLGGYAFTTQPIPVSDAGSFNFTYEVGAGFELYRDANRSDSIFGNRSLRAEYRFHHLSNADTANANPGIDSGLLQITYAFGR